MKKSALYIIILIFSLKTGFTQESDTIKYNIDSLISDTISTANDSIHTDTLVTKGPQPIDKVIEYSSSDSIYFSLDSMTATMFGNCVLTSEDMTLKAGEVKIDFKNNEMTAYSVKDSTGKTIKPYFTDNKDEFTASNLRYNFKTRKGLALNVKTHRTEGYLHGERVKIFPSGEADILHGKFTTCDLDHPHFYIEMTKAKYIPKKSIISGPFYFVIEDIPLYPLGFPFGFFPQRDINSSGIIQPKFVSEVQRGLGIIDGGYYLVLNDYMDLKVTGDIYSKGSWGLTVASNFKKRYKFSGNFLFDYSHISTGEKILYDSYIDNTFNLQTNYRQDPKANPTSNFSMSINLMKGNHRQYNAQNINDFTNNQTASSISYQKNFRGTPFHLSLTGNARQNLTDSTIALNFPTASFKMDRIYLFKPKNKPPKGTWYEKIGLTFDAQFKSTVKTRDSVFFNHPELLPKQANSGFRYSVPLSTSFKMFKYITVSPSFNYNGYVYFNYIEKHTELQDSQEVVVVDTIWKTKHLMDFRSAVSMSTKLYGMFNINQFGIKAIRHVMTPTISYNYRPDFSDPMWGYYLPEPDDPDRYYSIYQNGVYGYPSAGESQSVNFGVSNNFQMKVKSKNDTTDEYKKVNLIDNLYFGGSYNLAADSLNMSYLSLRMNSRFGNLGSYSFNMTFDPYAIDQDGRRINRFEVQETGKLLRLTQLSLNLQTSLNSNTLKKNREKDKQAGQGGPGVNRNKYIPYHYFDPQWTLRARYSFNLRKSFNTTTQNYDISLNQVLNINFNIDPTPFWKVGITSGYDFNAMKLTSTTFNLYRDLHCWQMSLQITPFGRMKSYFFSIKIKSSIFQGLELKRQRSWVDNLYTF